MDESMDLFKRYGVNPNSDDQDDLFKRYGITPDNKNSSLVDSLYNWAVNSSKDTRDATLGFGDAATNLPRSIANMIAPKSMQTPLARNSSGTAYNIGNFAGDLAGIDTGGTALDAARIASESAPGITGKIAQYMGGNNIPQALSRMVPGGALYGASQSPDDRLGGATMGAATGAIAPTALGIASKISPSNFLASTAAKNLSKEQLAEKLRITQGTSTDIGNIIGSPSAKGLYENLLQKLPFSGGDQATQKTSDAITKQGNEILSKYLGDTNPYNVNKEIADSLKQAKIDNTKQKNALYDDVSKEAEKSGLKVDLPTFANELKTNSQLLSSQPLLNDDPEIKGLMSKLSNYQNKVANDTGSLLGMDTKNSPKISEVNMLAGRLRGLSEDHFAANTPTDTLIGGIYKKLSTALKQDIKGSIENSGSESLMNKYRNAEQNYRENFSPFFDKDIHNFTSGRVSPDNIISSFVKTGPNSDQGEQIGKLMSKLDPKSQDLVKYAYLSRALKHEEGDPYVSPGKLATLFGDNKLGINQKKQLFPDPKERKKLSDYAELIKMNNAAITRMFNPHTGQRNLLPILASSAAKAFDGFRNGPVRGSLGLASHILTPIVGGRAATKFLTSEPTREKIIQKAISGDLSKVPQSASQVNTIAQAIANYLKNRNQ